jgi:hypothetical protein
LLDYLPEKLGRYPRVNSPKTFILRKVRVWEI